MHDILIPHCKIHKSSQTAFSVNLSELNKRIEFVCQIIMSGHHQTLQLGVSVKDTWNSLSHSFVSAMNLSSHV